MNDTPEADAQKPVLMFVRSVERDYERNDSHTTTAMCVSSIQADDLEYSIWQGSSSKAQELKIVKTNLLSRGTVWADGKLKSKYFDGRVDMDSGPRGVIRASENCLVITTYPMLNEGAEPCFLSSSISCSQVRVHAEIELNVSSYYDLADVQAYIAYHQHLAATGQHHISHKHKVRQINQFIKDAHQMLFQPGQFLPASLEIDGAEVPCVLHLRRFANHLFFRRTKRFYADIYVAGNYAPDKITGPLFRDVFWGENAVLHCQTILANILNVRSDQGLL